MTELIPPNLTNGNEEFGKINLNGPSQNETIVLQKNKALKLLSESNIERLFSDFIGKAVNNDATINPDLLHEEIMVKASEMAKKIFFYNKSFGGFDCTIITIRKS